MAGTSIWEDSSLQDDSTDYTDRAFGANMFGERDRSPSVDRWRKPDWCGDKLQQCDWHVDYRVRSMFSSSTAYEFGTPEYQPDPFAPISRLEFALNSTWHGLRIEAEKPRWRIGFEWLTPMHADIGGVMADYDWDNSGPPSNSLQLESLTHSALRWNEGQMLELEAAFQWTDSLLGRSVRFWPVLGFRFQRFDMTAYSLNSLVPPDGPDPSLDGVDVIHFKQQYYMGYFGGEFSTTTRLTRRIPLALTFRGDLGPTAAYNVDHHLLREGERYTKEKTHGLAWHVRLGLETPLAGRFAAGLQADYLAIHTTGTHRWVNEPFGIDMQWRNGVVVSSQQVSLTAYLRANF